MASSSGSSLVQNSDSEDDHQKLMDIRKIRRLVSNRESARRSRWRKKKHLDNLTTQLAQTQKVMDDLITQLAQLKKENTQIITSMNVTSQHYLNIEAENSILRAQVAELSHRLQSLNPESSR